MPSTVLFFDTSRYPSSCTGFSSRLLRSTLQASKALMQIYDRSDLTGQGGCHSPWVEKAIYTYRHAHEHTYWGRTNAYYGGKHFSTTREAHSAFSTILQDFLCSLFFFLLNIGMKYVMAGYTLEEFWKVHRISSCIYHEAGRHIFTTPCLSRAQHGVFRAHAYKVHEGQRS